MMALPLHAGTEHPDLALLAVSSLCLFVVGLGIGLYRDRVDAIASAITATLTRW
jgi:hypothetical protein